MVRRRVRQVEVVVGPWGSLTLLPPLVGMDKEVGLRCLCSRRVSLDSPDGTRTGGGSLRGPRRVEPLVTRLAQTRGLRGVLHDSDMG